MKNQQQFLDAMEELARQWDVSAAVIVQDKEGRVCERAFGYADRDAGRKMTLQERFCLSARVSFYLNACVLRLVEEGKLRLNAKISAYLPEYPQGNKITLKHLLRGESGLEDYVYHVRFPAMQKEAAHAALSDAEKFQKEYAVKAEDASFQEVLSLVGDMELEHAPGEDADYSATGAVFLEEIIRRASGMEPMDYLMTRVFWPLGMRDTRPGNDATVRIRGCLKEKELVPLPNLSPRHAFTTTLEDMQLLTRALAEGTLFSPALWKAALAVDREEQGLGVEIVNGIYVTATVNNPLIHLSRLYFDPASQFSMLILAADDFCSRVIGDNWHAFPPDLRGAYQDAVTYPIAPKLERITRYNVWNAMELRVRPEQLAFVPDVRECIADSLARRQPAYVLMDQGRAIGLAALDIEPKENKYYISYIQIDKRYQGRGFGKIMMLQAIEILKSKGATSLTIGVNRFNIPAQRLYMSVGFQIDSVYDGGMHLKMQL